MTQDPGQEPGGKLLEWMARALVQEVPPALIVEIMKRGGFSEDVIRSKMGERFPGPEDRIQVCNDFVALSKPRLVTEPEKLGAVAIDNPNIQLYVIDDFLDQDLCKELLEICQERSKPSKVLTGAKPYYRTSSTSMLYPFMSDVVSETNRRMANTLGISANYAESLQGQVYSTGQEYKPHTDFLTPAYMQELKRNLELSGPRTWTFMVYLNKPRKGGRTEFTEINEQIEPQTGRAVVWNNLKPNGMPNPYTTHRGCPVDKGSKVILTKWFRNEGYGPIFVPSSH